MAPRCRSSSTSQEAGDVTIATLEPPAQITEDSSLSVTSSPLLLWVVEMRSGTKNSSHYVLDIYGKRVYAPEKVW